MADTMENDGFIGKTTEIATEITTEITAEIERSYWLKYFLDVTLGGTALCCSLLFFGFALYMEWNKDLTPRVANRPKGVLKRAIFHHLPEWTNNPFFYPIAWIGWAYQLTYTECFNGIPGTGTRKDGKEGPLLSCNLDTIIMMRYHALLFKVGVLVFILCTFVILPVNTTADCDPATFGNGTCVQRDNAVDDSFFAWTTIDNIPDKVYNPFANATLNRTFETNDLFIGINEVNSTEDFRKFLVDVLWLENQTWRVGVTVISCLIIYIYTLYLLAWEWVENVALRREYYLEASHYSRRIAQLNETTFEKDKRDSFYTKGENDLESGSEKKKNLFGCCKRNGNYKPEHLTHPEITETPPSVGTFSVLYQFPSSMVTFDTEGATTVERQLVATTNFFDEIIPPEPGFSSSVAAVTVLPNASLLAKAKAKWNVCERKLQQLRYVRQKIRQAEESQEEGEQNERERPNKLELETKDGILTATPSPLGPAAQESLSTTIDSNTSLFKYEDFDVMEYAKSIGFDEEVNSTVDFVKGMDIEEFNVFAFKCAELAGKSLSCNSLMYNRYGIEELRELESDILVEIRQANEELLEARKDVAMFGDENVIEETDIGSNDDDKRVEDEETSEFTARVLTTIRKRRAALKSKVVLVGSRRFSMQTRSQKNDDIRDEPKASLGYGLWSALKCILLAPKRLYCGKDGRNDLRKKELKYYGTEDIFETERGRSKAFATNLGHPSYVVVTFTSRYAAVVARQCLADGAPRNRWKQVDDIPLYPLADSPPSAISTIAVVTPTISFASKKIRRWIVLFAATVITVTNVYILDLINSFILKPDRFSDLFGITLEEARSWSSTASGLVQTIQFSVAPYIFQILANIEGSATSEGMAQRNAILYFWFFYVLARFMGKIIWDAVLSLWAGSGAEESINVGITELSRSATSTLGPLAWTYIIYSCTLTWPLIYFLQLGNLSTSAVGLNFVNRLLKKGGPGVDAYYRIYVDSGYIFACMTALAPICPILGFACLLYFIIVTPMLRWLMVFTFRPRFDGGGDKWPRLHTIIVTSLVLGQIITSITLFLKGNNIEGLFIGFLILPTLVYNSIILEKFLRPYQEAALLQTRRMHSHFSEDSSAWKQREEFRRWLVDCHKASYLPTCLSGGDENLLTAEPAVVFSETQKEGLRKEDEIGSSFISGSNHQMSEQRTALLKRQKAQKGGILRRQRFNLS